MKWREKETVKVILEIWNGNHKEKNLEEDLGKDNLT